MHNISQSAPRPLCDESVFVLGQLFSGAGGAAKATRLLVEALTKIFAHVELFVSTRADPDMAHALALRGVEVTTPITTRGCRWHLPQRSIVLQLLAKARRKRPLLIHTVGLGREACFLLALPAVAPIFLWESTEALPDVAFVDLRISAYIHRAAAVLVPSRTVGNNVRATYRYQGDIRVLPFWVDRPSGHRVGTHSRTQNFIFVGRLDIDKGFRYLFEAFRQTLIDYPGASLTVCGGGPIKPIQELAKNTSEILVRGYVGPLEYEQLMDHCDALVLPSLHEGYPLVLLEACGRGKPIIATRVGSIPEVFENEDCAVLVEPRDAAGLNQAFQLILSEDDRSYERRQASP